MQAIAAVEHRLGQNPDDASAWDLKRLLYADLAEAEYLTRVVEGKPPTLFDHAYASPASAWQINDPARWLHDCEFLRIAARGLPAQAPTIYLTIAKAHEQAGIFAEVWNYFDRIMQAGRTFGPDNLADQDKATFFAVVKALGEDAAKRGDNDTAIENFCIFANYERAGVNVYRTLAELFERKGDIWSALYATHHGLVLDKTDRDLLDRRDRYYYSIQPAELPDRWDRVRMWFDVAYCKEKRLHRGWTTWAETSICWTGPATWPSWLRWPSRTAWACAFCVPAPCAPAVRWTKPLPFSKRSAAISRSDLRPARKRTPGSSVTGCSATLFECQAGPERSYASRNSVSTARAGPTRSTRWVWRSRNLGDVCPRLASVSETGRRLRKLIRSCRKRTSSLYRAADTCPGTSDRNPVCMNVSGSTALREQMKF